MASILHNNNNDNNSEEELHKLESWLIAVETGRKPPVVKFRASSLSKMPPLQVGRMLNLSFRTSQSDTWLVGALLSAHGLTEVGQSCNDFNLLWTGSHPRPHTFSSLKPHQRVNHFPRSYELTRKDRLYKNVARLQHCHGSKHFDFLPNSFVMPNEYRDFWSAHHRLHGPWIVKPVASSRGRGIYLVSKPEEVPLEEPVLVSKYIANPLLVDGHKCDLRLYVAVTSYDPLVIYLYRHGIVRFAAVKYTADQSSLDNPCIHLCNYSINKYHADFVVSEDPSVEDTGHKRSLTGFLKCLRAQGKDVNRLMKRIEDVIIKSIMAAAPPVVAACKMFVPHRTNCFELYGFDILIDEDLKPWLLEVNLSPSLGCDSPLDLRVKSSMLSDLLTLVGLPAVDPTAPGPAATTTNGGPPRTARARTAPTTTERKQFRRAQSADTRSDLPPPRTRLTFQSQQQRSKLINATNNSSSTTTTTTSLTAEESRILSQLREDFERRGDFNRIFPTEETWSVYGDFIETLGSSPVLASPAVNYNRMLHERLFPQTGEQGVDGVSSSLAATVVSAAAKLLPGGGGGRNRLNWSHPNWRSLNEEPTMVVDGGGGGGGEESSYYEQAVLQPITIESRRRFDRVKMIKKPVSVKAVDALNEKSSTQQMADISQLLDDHYILSQEQSRRGFSRYLRCVQQRLPGLLLAETSHHQLDLIEKFLVRLGGSSGGVGGGRLRSASPGTSPMKTNNKMNKLVGSDRVASLASRLGEFLDRYEATAPHRHHHSPSANDCGGGNGQQLKMVDSQVFDDFLLAASEKELEEVLFKHSKKAPCCHFLSGRCASTSRLIQSRNLGLLREACLTTTATPPPPPSSAATGRPPLRASATNNKPKQQQETDCRNSSASASSVVTFDLRRPPRPVANASTRPSSVHSRASILKRETSM